MTKLTEKIGKMWEDKTGVSPIIAVILMVAITVVLAATIYVWVSGFGGSGGSAESLSANYLSKDDTVHNATFQVAKVSTESIEWADLEAQVVTAAGVVTADCDLYYSPSTETYVKAGQTFTINSGAAGTFYFQLKYDDAIIWKSVSAYTV